MEDKFSQVTSLISDPVRSKIMWALLDGRAYTATELANYTGTTPQNISMHLARLVNSGLLSVEKQGRHRYYNYARVEVSYAIEALANLIPPEQRIAQAVTDEPVQFCRSCYDHLAGKVGVMMTEQLVKRKVIFRSGEDYKTGRQAKFFFNQLGIDVEKLRQQKRSFARVCLDWSERKPHLAGALGASLFEKLLADHWIRRTQNSRAITVTGKGRQRLAECLGLDI